MSRTNTALNPRRNNVIVIPAIIGLVTTVLCVSAQQPSTVAPPQQGVSTIDAVLQPIGKEQAIRNLDGCVVKGALRQGTAVGTFTWKSAGQEFWGESDVDSVHVVAASNHGNPMRLENGRTMELPTSALVNPVPLYNVGLYLLHSRDNPAVAIDASPAAVENATGIRITQSKMNDPYLEAAYETWTFNPQTGLPASHTFKPFVYKGRPLAATATYKFSEYREVSGVNVPRHLEEYVSDQLIHAFDIQSIQCGVELSGSDFEIAGGGK